VLSDVFLIEEFIVPLLMQENLILLVFSVCGNAMLLPEYLGEAVANYELVKLVTEMMWTSRPLPHMIGADVIYGVVYF